MKTFDQLFLEYQKEEYGREVLFSENGFAVIEFLPHGECLIWDFKSCGEGLKLLGEVERRCLEEKATHISMISSTNQDEKRQKKCTKMVRTLALLGFEICGARNDQVVMIKRLNEGE